MRLSERVLSMVRGAGSAAVIATAAAGCGATPSPAEEPPAVALMVDRNTIADAVPAASPTKPPDEVMTASPDHPAQLVRACGRG